MKRYVILLLVFFVQLGFAQDIIKLKSGQVINGKIIDTIDNRTVRIELEDGKKSILNKNQISRSNFAALPPHKMKYVLLAEQVLCPDNKLN